MSMDHLSEGPCTYVVPSYKAPEDVTWYHFLHGNVPGHQIDFIYRPEVPQGRLMPQHFSHLSRLMRYIEPQANNPYAFAIGNLSRDDAHHEPGRGGLALILALRVRGIRDHAGRPDPPFAHGIAAIDLGLDFNVLLQASTSFCRLVAGGSGVDTPAGALYRKYASLIERAPSAAADLLKAYIDDFKDLPRPRGNAKQQAWLTGGSTQSKRILIVHPDDASFDAIAGCAARLAAVLYRSDVRWTLISNGREEDVPNGVSIRFVSRLQADAEGANVFALPIEQVPTQDAEIARVLFGAQRAADSEGMSTSRPWRDNYRELPSAPVPVTELPALSMDELGQTFVEQMREGSSELCRLDERDTDADRTEIFMKPSHTRSWSWLVAVGALSAALLVAYSVLHTSDPPAERSLKNVPGSLPTGDVPAQPLPAEVKASPSQEEDESSPLPDGSSSPRDALTPPSTGGAVESAPGVAAPRRRPERTQGRPQQAPSESSRGSNEPHELPSIFDGPYIGSRKKPSP